jgi:hypothetical protein
MLGQRDAVVDPAHRQHAETGPPGPCTNSISAGSMVSRPILEDRVGMAAPDLHQLQGPPAAGLDLAGVHNPA